MNDKQERKNDFLQSLDSITADDICKKKKKRSVSDFIFDNLRYFLMLVCFAVLVVSVISIAKSLKGYADQDEIYDSIGNMIMKDSGVEIMFKAQDMPITPDYEASQNLSSDDLENITAASGINREYERVRVKLLNLKSQYPDLYGWITVSDTGINYPIMQSADNEYYLTHSYTGANLTAGAIFADCACDRTLMNNKNLVIYGHHMANKSMFYQLDSFLVESFFKNKGKVTIYTLDGMYTYEVFSVYETNMHYPYIMTFFGSNERFMSFVNEMKSNSIYQKDNIVFDENTRILTMSTCNNRYEDGRLAVHAVLTEYYQSK